MKKLLTLKVEISNIVPFSSKNEVKKYKRTDPNQIIHFNDGVKFFYKKLHYF